jgi:hypothetical protein
MNKTMHGVVHGRTIELDSDPGIEAGRKVEVILRVKQLPAPPPRWTPDTKETAGGMMADFWTEQDDLLLEEIHQQRKKDLPREIPE